jgi:predicted acyltransferase (DUF342 family)
MAMKAWQNSRGGALVTVLLVLTIIITLGTSLLTLAAGEFQIAFNHTNGIKAFYLAEAGVSYAINTLTGDRTFRISNRHYDLGDIEFILTIANGPSPQIVIITSRATVGNATRTIVAEVTIPINLYFSRFVTTTGTARNNIDQHVTIVGDILSNQDLHVEQHPRVTGWVISKGNITGPGETQIANRRENDTLLTIPPPVVPSYPARAVPVLPENWWLPPGLGSPIIINRNVTSVGDFTGGNHFRVNGNVSLGNNINLSNVTIVANGNISIGNNSSLTNVVLKADGGTGRSITIGERVIISNSTLVADGALTIRQDVNFQGTTFSGGNTTIEQNLDITGNSSLYAMGTFMLEERARLFNNSVGIYSAGSVTIEEHLSSSGSLEIVANGNVNIEEHTTLNIANIYSLGAINIEQHFRANNLLLSSRGNLRIEQHAAIISGEIFSQGTISIDQHFNRQAGITFGDLVIAANSHIDIEQHSRIQGLIYSYQGRLTAEEHVQFTGSIFAASFYLGQHGSYTFNQGIVDRLSIPGIPGGGGRISLSGWSER